MMSASGRRRLATASQGGRSAPLPRADAVGRGGRAARKDGFCPVQARHAVVDLPEVRFSQAIAEIVELAKAIRAQRERGEQTGLSENELAFYDALSTNESAREAMKDEVMRAIAHDLTAIVRRDAKTDWQVKESVRAKL